MLPSQFNVPPEQFVHAPLVHVCVCGVHAEVDPHVPVPEHVCTPLPTHCVVPGTHTPTHAPFWHAEETQGVLFPQVPLNEHVSTLFPLQCVALGAQTPTQLPPTHA